MNKPTTQPSPAGPHADQPRLDRITQWSWVLLFFVLPISLAATNLMFLWLLLCWLLGLALSGGRAAAAAQLAQVWANPIALPALALAAWISLAALWSPAEADAVQSAFQKYLKFLLLPVFAAMLANPLTRRRCWGAFFLAMGITLASSYLGVVVALPWSITQVPGLGVDHSVFKNYIIQGVMMSLAICCALFCALRAAERQRSGLAAAWGLLGLLGAGSILFLSVGRTAYLAFFMATSVYLAFAFGSRWRLSAASLAGLGLLLGVALASSDQFQDRLQVAINEAKTSANSPQQPTSIGARIEALRFAIPKALESPTSALFGHGTGAFALLAERHYQDGPLCPVICPHPHNQFVFFAFEQGLIGLGLFLFLVAVLLRHGVRQPPPRRALVFAFVAILIANGMTHSSFWLATESHFMVLFIALFMGAAQPRRTLKRDAGPTETHEVQPASVGPNPKPSPNSGSGLGRA